MFAGSAGCTSAGTGVTVDVLDETQIARLDMGLLLGVARGSAEPPRLIVAAARARRRARPAVLGLVGKGITFDTGGISIKPADGMERMKDDMAGGAAVVAAMRALALLRRADARRSASCPRPRTCRAAARSSQATCCAAPAARRSRCVNTDAEGRLVLGDGCGTRASSARRTSSTSPRSPAPAWSRSGASRAACSARPTAGSTRVREARAAGDRCWPMPLFDDYWIS